MLNFPLGGLIILTIVENESFIYRDYIIYAMAFYTFYSFILSIVNIIKYKDYDNYIFKLSKTISFITSLVSIFTLQTAMISAFSSSLEFEFRMNLVTGSLVWIIIFILGIMLFIKSKKE